MKNILLAKLIIKTDLNLSYEVNPKNFKIKFTKKKKNGVVKSTTLRYNNGSIFYWKSRIRSIEERTHSVPLFLLFFFFWKLLGRGYQVVPLFLSVLFFLRSFLSLRNPNQTSQRGTWWNSITRQDICNTFQLERIQLNAPPVWGIFPYRPPSFESA